MSKSRLVAFLLVVLMVGTVVGIFANSGSPQESGKTTLTGQQAVAEPRHTFIMLGDAGTGIPVQTQVAEQVAAHCKQQRDCVAAFIAGDVIYDNGVKSVADPQFKTKFEQPYSSVELPFYIAYGNHDYLGCTECYLEYSQSSNKWKMPARYYQQDFDGVSFFVIDTEKFDVDQQKWLKEQLEQTQSTHKVVVGHRPLKTNEVEKVKENWQGKQELQDIVCTSAEYYISGHAHLLEEPGLIEGCTVKQLISGSAGSSPRQVHQYADSVFNASTNGFLSLQFQGNSSTYTFIDFQGAQLHTGP